MAEIYLDGVIGSEGDYFGTIGLKQVQEMVGRADASGPLQVVINSPGGEVYEGLAIYDYLRSMGRPVETVALGKTMSIASIIFLAADTRYISENATVLVHSPMSASIEYENADELTERAGELRALEQRMARLYADRTGGNESQWLELMRAETVFTADEAIAAGLATAKWKEKESMQAKAHKARPVLMINHSTMSNQANPEEVRNNLLKDIGQMLANAFASKPKAEEVTPEPEEVEEPQESGPTVEELQAQIAQLQEENAALKEGKEQEAAKVAELSETVALKDQALKAIQAKVNELEALPIGHKEAAPKPAANATTKNNFGVDLSGLYNAISNA